MSLSDLWIPHPYGYGVQASLLRVLETTPPYLFIYDTVACVVGFDQYCMTGELLLHMQ